MAGDLSNFQRIVCHGKSDRKKRAWEEAINRDKGRAGPARGWVLLGTIRLDREIAECGFRSAEWEAGWFDKAMMICNLQSAVY
jgi:hypothetical protein